MRLHKQSLLYRAKRKSKIVWKGSHKVFKVNLKPNNDTIINY